MSEVNNLNTDDIFKFMDLYFDRYGIIVSHLHNSFNKFIEEDTKLYLENGDHTFYEKIAKDKLIKYKFKYENISFKTPTVENSNEPLFPMDARNNNTTYSGKLLAKVSQIQEITDIVTGIKTERVIGHPVDNVPIANLPVMVKSKMCSLVASVKHNMPNECEYDVGGYFIVGGNEKVIISQDKMIDNKPMIIIKKDSGQEVYTAQINSQSYRPHGIKQIVNVTLKKDGNITIKIPVLQTEISVFIFFRALGFESDKSIINCITYDENDKDIISILETGLDFSRIDKKTKIYTQQDAQDYIIGKLKPIKKYSDTDKNIKNQQKRVYLNELLKVTFLPHIESDYITKGYYLGIVVNKLLRNSLDKTSDDRDSYTNKRVELPGDLLFELFRQYYRKMLNECNKFFKKRNSSDDEPINVIHQIKPNTIELGIRGALMLGTWPRKKNVAQMLSRYSYMLFLHYLRRVDSQGGEGSASKMTAPRNYHSSSVNLLCPVSTPEHAKVGLTKHLALIANVSIMQNSQFYIIRSYLKKQIKDIRSIPHNKMKFMTRVFFNGELMGVVEDSTNLVKLLRKNKQNGIFEKTISIVDDIQNLEIRVYCDSGRIYVPFMKVKDNIVQLTKDLIDSTSIDKTKSINKITDWDEFLIKHNNVIEYVDMEEMPYVMVSKSVADVEAERLKMTNSIKKVKDIVDNKVDNRYSDMMYTKYTHCIFHPSLLLAEIPNDTPFCNHDYGPRNIFQYAQKKQAMCTYTTNYRYRLDISYVLYNPQTPIVSTRSSKYIYSDMLPAGENCVVAIMVYGGYNQEDSMVVNASALDRGLFHSMSLKKEQSVIQKNQSTSMDDVFMKPDPSKVTGLKQISSYDKINDKGYVPEETKIYNGDVIISKLSPIQPIGNSSKVYKDNSVAYKSHASAVIDKVYTNIYNSDGYEMIKVRIRSDRKPQIGDKFCLRPTAEVLTSKGWQCLKDIDIKEVDIATMDPKTFELKYVKAFSKPEFDYDSKVDGQMYHVKTQQVHTVCTPNHKNFVKKRYGKEYEFVTAKDCFGKFLNYKKDCVNTYPEQKTIEFDGHTYPMNTYMRFLGMFLGDGNIYKNALQLSMKKERKIKYIEKIAEEFKLEFKYCESSCYFSIGKTKIPGIFEEFVKLSVGAINKSIPNYVWKSGKENCRELLDGLMNSDGCLKNDSMRYSTSSKKLADDVQRLALHCGYSASIDLHTKADTITFSKDGKKFHTKNDAYRISINRKQNEPRVYCKRETDIMVEKWVDYKGKVMCLEIPETHLFYYRENFYECPQWTGNSSKHGQKGTIGIVMKQSDMPFTRDGITPDICINPNAIPSRMTIGHMIECIAGKTSTLQGMDTDGTSFENIDLEQIKDNLENVGYHRSGEEFMFNGMTGQKIRSMIYIGPTFYQRLKHLVDDKIHSRARGPLTTMTRQPPDGRSRDGGLRLGTFCPSEK